MTARVCRPLSRLAAGVLGGVLVAWLALPMVASATDLGPEESASDVEMGDEAWFFRHRQPVPEEVPDSTEEVGLEDPSGEGLDTAPAIGKAEVRNATGEIYPGEFVRVGINAGEEEARTYLRLPTVELGEGLDAVITGGTITLVAAPTSPDEPPEDVDPEAEDNDNAAAPNQRNVDNADIVACLTTGFVVSDIGGNWADRPEIDCEVRSPLERVEVGDDERPTWTLDLSPFVPHWEDPLDNFGVALVANPDSEDSEPAQSWHVAFPNSLNNLAGPPPLADLTLRRQVLPDFDFDDSGFVEDFDAPPPPQPQQDFAPAPGPTFDDQPFDEQPVDEPAVAEDPIGEPAEEPTPEAAPVDREVRTNPALALLPVLALGLAGLVGYSLSREPEIVGERDGAVSKLMERRARAAP